MLKLIVLIVIGFIIYKMFFNKKIANFNQNNSQQESDELVECSNCHTFVPKNECKFTKNGCLCKDCQ
jgi:uncharacterized protein